MAAYSAGELQALMAQNPEYNTSIADTLSFTTALKAIGFVAVKICAVPTNGQGAANYVPLQTLLDHSTRQDVPLNMLALFDGTNNYHNLGLLRRIVANYEPLSAYAQMFADIFGATDNWGRAPLNRLLEVPEVKAVVEEHIAAALQSEAAEPHARATAKAHAKKG